MYAIIPIVKIAVMLVSIILLVSSCVRLYQWRRSAFSSTNAYLKNLRYIHAGEKACIQAPDDPGIQYVCSGKDSKTWVYFEYYYTVEGVEYCKSYFYEDDEERLPSKIRMYYNMRNPKIVFREGKARDGVISSIASMILGSFLLFVLIISYIQ